MADVRALLRQQRAARRIEHPHAAYTDAGKLVCTVCSEHVKTESLWDGHLRSSGHRQRLQSLHQASKNGSNGYAGFVDQGAEVKGPSNKRKLSSSEEDTADHDDEALSRRKRTKPDGPSPEHTQQETGTPSKNNDTNRPSKPVTPPLARRTSGTPTAGVEMQIPSRPATPSTGGTPMATTPKAAPIGRSPLIPDEATASQQETIRGTRPSTTTTTTTGSAAAPAVQVPVDEDEWAAFEADLVHSTNTNTTEPAAGAAAAVAALSSDAVISAPVMSAAEIAAKSEEEERARRRAQADIQIEDEKEEATRALENEFEVMEELEARARRLRERREALRVQSNGGGAAPKMEENGGGKGTAAATAAAALGKENAAAVQEEEEDEDDEDEDDWGGFRFHA
jgi:zinc finger protein 830